MSTVVLYSVGKNGELNADDLYKRSVQEVDILKGRLGEVGSCLLSMCYIA